MRSVFSTGRAALTTLAFTTVMLACGCKVVSIAEDRALREARSGAVDASALVAREWEVRLLPELVGKATDIASLWPDIARDPAAAGAAHGRQASEGSDWTFVVRGQGRLTAVDRASRTGMATLEVPQVGSVSLPIGPVLVTSAIRDAIPSLRFDDFPDQMSFAEVNRALNAKAVDAATALRKLSPGAQVSFVGVLQAGAPGQAVVVVPVRIDTSPAAGG